MKITKTMAEKTAKQMGSDAMDAAIAKAKKALGESVYNLAKRDYPKEVLSVFENPEYKKYFQQHSRTSVSCNGSRVFNSSINMEGSLPGWAENTEVSDSEAETLKKLYHRYCDLTEKRQALITKIESTILAFGTLKKLEAGFKEAYDAMADEFKQKESKLVPAVRVDDLLMELNQYK